MFKFLHDLGRDTRGATAVEYGLILALVFLAMLGAAQSFGTKAAGMWTHIETTVLTSIAV
ncbi:Flp family type IVb pilin [Qipengyuania qiaonensis]|uniref:Flp family type IVb pilin n=1 Tax=Qipengyuania qiaonensis TaxID=2867240 RepID=A0ABS7J135_9SPHN|nr:Flp family type IVb pilin [Qipengyuania qiaonensis]MBX7480977.1 Flp family type IVb pilin [Qipengyuania qiaonensis]